MYFLNQLEGWFIDSYIEKVEDYLEKIRIKMIFRFSMMIGAILLMSMPTIFSFGIRVTTTAVVIMLFCFSIPFVIKYKETYHLLSKLFFIGIFCGTAIIHIFLGIPNLLTLGIWYVVIALASSFVLDYRWGFGFTVLAISNIAFISLLRYYHIHFFQVREQVIHPIFVTDTILLATFVRAGAPFLIICYVIYEYIRNREQIENHTKSVLKKVENSEAVYRHLIEEADDMIYEVDTKGFISFFNPAAAKKFNVELNEKGKPQQDLYYTDLVCKETHEEHITFFREQLKEKRSISYREFPAIAQGKRIWVGQKTKVYYDENGRILKMLCIGRDITKQKEDARKLIQAKEEAIKANLVKAQFLSSMSHEIRTPMNAVIGLTHLLLKENPNENQKEHLETLKFSAENLLALINDILDFSKIEAGKIELKESDVNLQQVLKNIHHGLGSKALEKKISLELNYDEKLPAIVKGDALRVFQIMNNLVGNAIKFTDKGGVVVDVLQSEVGENTIDIFFSVKDTGIGIPDHELENIFQDFTQINDETIREGTGLGLHITRQLLQLQGSKIYVKSKVGEGSTFYFTLRFKKSERQNSANSKAVPDKIKIKETSLQGIKLLMVEDNVINQKVTMNFLKKWGIEVDIADNGQIALDKTKEKDYDIVLMDLQMPVMNGLEATKHIRARGGKYQELPILALTASAVLEVKENALEAGLNDFITKPFTPNVLYQKIVQYIPQGVRMS